MSMANRIRTDDLSISEIGAVRHTKEDYLVDSFVRAYTEDSDLAMKILFYGRDIRGDLGEHRVFRTYLRLMSPIRMQCGW